MGVRRCATQGCSGTLPAGTGTHCPRCGGTRLVRERGVGRRGVVITLLGLASAFVVRSFQKHAEMPATGPPSGRRALEERHEARARMSNNSLSDEAYAH